MSHSAIVDDALDAPARRVPLLVDRPEALAAGASLVAWLILIAGGVEHGDGAGHAGHAVSIFVMVVATMAPFSIPMLRMVVLTRQWWLASRMVLGAFLAFVLTWLAVGLGLHVVTDLLRAVVGGTAAVQAAWLVAACGIVALGPSRPRRIESCLSLRPGAGIASSTGGRGVDAALACARLCLLPMVAMLVLPGSWPLMAALTGIGLAERTILVPRRVLVAVAYFAVAAAILLLPG